MRVTRSELEALQKVLSQRPPMMSEWTLPVAFVQAHIETTLALMDYERNLQNELVKAGGLVKTGLATVATDSAEGAD